MKKSKKILSILVSSCLIISLSGCSVFGKKEVDEGPTKEELAAQVSQLTSENESLQSQLNGTKEILATYDPTLANIDLSAITVLPTGIKAYNAINDKIRLSKVFTMEPSKSMPNTTNVNLGGNVVYTPSNNWSFDLSNNVLSLKHKNGMVVNLKVYDYVGQSTPYDVMDTSIRPYLQDLNVEEVEAKKLFVNDNVVGGLITTNMKVKEYISDNGDLEVEQYEEESTEETSEVDVNETGETSEITDSEVPKTNFGDLGETETSTEETTVPSESESIMETTVGSLDDLMETSESNENNSENNTEDELGYEIIDYRYTVAVAMYGDYALTIEGFYRNDENASIQEELFNSCMNSIQINKGRLVVE